MVQELLLRALLAKQPATVKGRDKMKDNMVQELLLRALLAKQPATAAPSTNTNQRQNASLSTQNNSREVLTALLKSLYLNNAPKQTASNTNNTNFRLINPLFLKNL